MPSAAEKDRMDAWEREVPTSAMMAAAGSASGGIDADVPSDDATRDIDVPRQRDELFPEDTGTCPLLVRHAIAALIKRRYISADEDKVAWDGLMSDPDLVRSRLADCLLTLKISRGAGIALAQQVELEDNTVPYKIKSITYFNNVQSLLITQLVTKYFSSTAAGESAVWVEEEEMCETMMRLFEDAPDVAAADQAMRQAIAAMERNHYLRKIVDGRYQIMPVVGVVYTLDEISALLARYGMGKEASAQEEESDE